tara:strand:+ start:363 stop:626 length:264 start_codon:yes stop_codon:yes gene_type:complete
MNCRCRKDGSGGRLVWYLSTTDPPQTANRLQLCIEEGDPPRFGTLICGISRASGLAVDTDDIVELEELFARLRTKLESIGKTVPNGI